MFQMFIHLTIILTALQENDYLNIIVELYLYLYYVNLRIVYY